MYRIDAIPMKISMSYLTGLEKITVEFIDPQKTTNSQSKPKSKNNQW